MAIIRDANKADFTFQIDGGAADKLQVAAFYGVEAVSQPFRFTLRLASTDSALKPPDFLAKPGLLTIRGATADRFIHGIVMRFECVERGQRKSTYEVDLGPQLALSAYRAGCRIFQNETIPDIIKKVLEENGIAADRMEFKIKQGDFKKREYCVQYRETDFNFVSRLLEEEGIFYFFRHAQNGHTLVFCDANSGIEELAGGATLKFQPGSGLSAKDEVITGFRFGHEVGSGGARLREFNPLTPSVKLDSQKTADRDADRMIYDFPARTLDESETKRQVELHLQEFRATRQRGHGQASCRRFSAGFRFTLQEHPQELLNNEYLITRVLHTASQPQVFEETSTSNDGAFHDVQFDCTPQSVPFRAERTTPRPRILGAQSAIVVGPAGEKLHMDDKGRAKVKFFWDLDPKNDDTVSCFVRVSSPYAGIDHGIQFHPLVGDEVLVSFIDGDPDRPVITNRVYNATNMPPLKPDDKIQNVILTPAQHRLLFDDKGAHITMNTGGGESMVMADGGEDSEFGNSITLRTADEHVIAMGNGSKLKGISLVTEQTNTILLSDGDDPGIFATDKSGSLTIALDSNGTEIKIQNDASGSIKIIVPGGTVTIEAADLKVDASNSIELKAASSIKLAAANIEIAADMALEAKGLQTKIEGTAQMEVTGGMTKLNGDGMCDVVAGGVCTIKGALVKIN